MTTRANEPAFPKIETEPSIYAGEVYGNTASLGGLTKREYFAGLAMQGILSEIGSSAPKVIAEWAVEAADALLAELERGSG